MHGVGPGAECMRWLVGQQFKRVRVAHWTVWGFSLLVKTPHFETRANEDSRPINLETRSTKESSQNKGGKTTLKPGVQSDPLQFGFAQGFRLQSAAPGV